MARGASPITYLQLINRVLRELREAQVTSLAADYTLLIGQYVNESKYEIETAWQWKALRTDITFSTVAGTKDYNLGAGGVGSTATNERATLLMDQYGRPLVYDLTHKTMLSQRPDKIMTQLVAENQLQNTLPAYFSERRLNTGVTLRIYAPPDGVYSMQASFYVPQDELTATTDILTIPAEPVWRSALAKAALERGGGQGDNPTRLELKAERILSDAIVREAEDAELTMIPW